MMTDLLTAVAGLLAQSADPATQPAGGDAPFWAKLIANPLAMLSVGLVLFYFFIIRQKNKTEAQKKAELNSVKKGDTIETIGGLIGSVVSADESTVVLKVDETANVKMKFNRRAIHRVISDEKKG